MEFDLVIGNPPFSRGTVKHHHAAYKHTAMNAGREGNIGFLIECLKYLKNNAVLSFIAPIKYLRGPGCTKTRAFLFKTYKLVSVQMKNPKIFKSVGVDKIGVSTWTTGQTTDIDVDGVIIHSAIMPDCIVPAFESQAVADQYVIDIQNGLLGRPIGGPKPKNENYKVVFAKTFFRGFRIEQPGYALGFYENAYEVATEDEAKRLMAHMSQMTFMKKWSAIQFQRNGNHVDTHCIARYCDGIQRPRHTELLTQYMPSDKRISERTNT